MQQANFTELFFFQATLQVCFPPYPFNAERQAGKLGIPTFLVFWFVSTRESNTVVMIGLSATSRTL